MTTDVPLRKLLHFSGNVIPLMYLATGRRFILAVTAFLFILDAVLEVARIRGRFKYGFLQKQLKEAEAERLTGSFYFLLSSLITILFFEKAVAVSSMLILAVSDPLSSLVGQRCAWKPLFGKSIQGTGVFFLSSIAILLCFSFKSYTIIAAASAATATELFSSLVVDDNLAIPLVTAAVLALLT